MNHAWEAVARTIESAIGFMMAGDKIVEHVRRDALDRRFVHVFVSTVRKSLTNHTIYSYVLVDLARARSHTGPSERGHDLTMNSPFVERCMQWASRQTGVTHRTGGAPKPEGITVVQRDVAEFTAAPSSSSARGRTLYVESMAVHGGVESVDTRLDWFRYLVDGETRFSLRVSGGWIGLEACFAAADRVGWVYAGSSPMLVILEAQTGTVLSRRALQRLLP